MALLPTLRLDEQRMVEGLREGEALFTIRAVEAAYAGDEVADWALRLVFVEMSRGLLPERRPGHLQVWAYGQRAVLRDARKCRQR
jgi:hypothetical protein